MMVAFVCTCFVSCGDDVDELESDSQGPTELEKKLFNTSWKLIKSVAYYRTYTEDNLSKEPQLANSVITFSRESDGDKNLYLNGQYVGFWYQREEDHYLMLHFTQLSNSDQGLYRAVFGFGNATLKNNTLQIRWDNTNLGTYHISTYTKTNTTSITNDGASPFEKPEIGWDGFSATKTSLTVKYRIFNKEKANITSAHVYYGTTSNPSLSVTASISGVFITATISGLNKGTEYWVKCKATGSGGSTTTDVTKCITNY